MERMIVYYLELAQGEKAKNLTARLPYLLSLVLEGPSLATHLSIQTERIMQLYSMCVVESD